MLTYLYTELVSPNNSNFPSSYFLSVTLYMIFKIVFKNGYLRTTSVLLGNYLVYISQWLFLSAVHPLHRHAFAKNKQTRVLARTETVDSDDGNCPFHPRTNGGQPLKPMVPEPKTMVPKKIIESMQ